MPAASILIRSIEPRDDINWHELWQAYLVFYEAELPDSTTNATWDRIIGADPTFGGLVAEDPATGTILGIANFILHPSTWSESSFCLLNDLFVTPAARGRGAGRAMIQHLIDLAGAEGWARVYWVTKEDNATARTLYDRFAPTDGFIRYTVRT